jgi:predicted lipoprotein with Yx(FWY)xxD motif
MRKRGMGAAGAATGLGGLGGLALLLLLAACGSSGTNLNAGAAYSGSGMGATPSSSSMTGAGTTSGSGAKTVVLTIKNTKIGPVLTDAKGDTLYWYAKDTRDGPSTCTGACLAAWPAVLGQAVAAPGVKFAGQLGDVTDAGGAIQATYNGYPLYTYQADMAPGQTTGNGAGGVWHAITGSTLTAAAGRMSSSSASKTVTSSGGYGYGSGVPASSGASSHDSGSAMYTSTGHTSTGHTSTTTAPVPAATKPAPAATTPAPAAPAPAPTSSVIGGGCGEGACW